MVRCETCVFFDGKRCTARKGKYFGKEIKDPTKEIDCISYIDNWIAFDMVEDIMEDML